MRAMQTKHPQTSFTDSVDIQFKPHSYINSSELTYQRETQLANGMKSKQKMGRAILQIVNLGAHPASMFDYVQSFNEYPGDQLHLIQYLNTALSMITADELPIHGTLAVLHHFEIFAAYRGQQLSRPFMSLILKALDQHTSVDFLLLQAFPIGLDLMEKEKAQTEINRLEKLYTQMGFHMVKERQLLSSNGIYVHYMYIRLSEAKS